MSSMKSHSITLEKQGALAWITLDRPGAGNAPDPEMAALLREACQQAGQDDAVQVVLVTGAGEQFCVAPAVTPLPWGRAPSSEAGPLATQEQLALGRIAAPVAALEKPVIAVLNGSAVGQGLELALACDLRLACPQARFAMPHVLAGLLPWDGGTQRLPRAVGRARALELLLTGREVDAQDAFAMGLVHQVVPREQLRSQAQEVAERAAACGPIALRYAKEAVRQGMEMGLLAGLRLEADLNILLHTTQDRAEGIRSFRDRRKAQFQGR